jgi:hypothetical protein
MTLYDTGDARDLAKQWLHLLHEKHAYDWQPPLRIFHDGGSEESWQVVRVVKFFSCLSHLKGILHYLKPAESEFRQ